MNWSANAELGMQSSPTAPIWGLFLCIDFKNRLPFTRVSKITIVALFFLAGPELTKAARANQIVGWRLRSLQARSPPPAEFEPGLRFHSPERAYGHCHQILSKPQHFWPGVEHNTPDKFIPRIRRKDFQAFEILGRNRGACLHLNTGQAPSRLEDQIDHLLRVGPPVKKLRPCGGKSTTRWTIFIHQPLGRRRCNP